MSAEKPQGKRPPQPLPQPCLQGSRTARHLSRTTYSPLALGKVLLDLEADRRVDVPAEGCVSSDPVRAEGTPGLWEAVGMQPGLGQGTVYSGPG